MKCTRSMVALLGVLVCGSLGAVTGESYKSAASLSAGKAVTVSLVPELNLLYDSKEDDPEDKHLDNGAYYFKFTATRGKAYTVTVTMSSLDSDVDSDILDITDMDDYDYEKGKDVSWPGFSYEDDPDGLTARFTLAADDWTIDEEDPEYSDDKTVTAYVYVKGSIYDEDGEKIAAKATVQLQNGVVPYKPPQGSDEEHPLSVTVGTTETSKTYKLFNGECWFKVDGLKAGQLYKFWTTGGTDDNSLYVSAEPVEPAEGDVRAYVWEGQGENDDGVIIVPSEPGAFLISVAGDGYGEFTLHSQTVGARTPEKHSATDLGSIGTTAASSPCEPGRRNDPKSGYWDQVIDQQLFKVTLKKGKTYVFETEGASTNLVMELYDSKGKALVANRRGFADRPFDCKLAYKAESSTDYWVGVCQDLDDDDNDPLAKTPCTLKVTQVSEGILDEYDNGDDTVEGANPLAPEISSSWKKGSAHGPHTFGATDWTDTYSIACRKGVTYKLGIVFVDEKDPSASAWKLPARVWTLDADGKETDVTAIADLAAGGNFTPALNATYYISVAPEDGQGVDYGAHMLMVAAYSKSGLGRLAVDFGGPTVADGAGWYLSCDGTASTAPHYAPGTICLPAGDYTVKFVSVDGWTKPKSRDVKVETDKLTVLDGIKYNDDHDAADLSLDATEGDGAKKAPLRTKLSISYKETQRTSRSLWAEDLADWYYFSAKENVRYVFALENSAGTNKLGDATITVYRANCRDILGQGRSVAFNSREAATCYLVVSHAGDEPVDSQYALTYAYQKVGAVGFEAESYSVKDNAASVSVKVVRTGGSTGAVRLRYTTRSGEGEDAAVAGKDYVPDSGFLTWADGEDDAKTITVKLLPELVSAWRDARSFKLELAELDPGDVEEDDIQPILVQSETEVVIKDASKKAPGTVEFAASTATVPAGQRLAVTLKRSTGTDGTVGVTLKTAKSSAKPGVNYVEDAETIVFGPGETEKTFTLVTLDTLAEYQAPVKMSLRIEVDESQPDVCKLGTNAKTVVTIVDPNATRSFADYSAACAARTGISVAEGASETWFFDEAGTLRNVTPPNKGESATLTYTLTGPGKLAFIPNFLKGHSKNTLTCKIGSETVTCVDGQRVVRYINQAADKTTKVQFTVKRTCTGTGECYLWFDPEEDGMPLLWKPLQKPALLAPVSAEVVSDDSTLRWVDAVDEEVVYIVSMATKTSILGNEKYNKEKYISQGKVVACNFVQAAAEFPMASYFVLPDTKYYWRVDAAFLGAASQLTVTNDTWSFQTAAEDVPVTQFREGQKDMVGNPILPPAESGRPWDVTLVKGVRTTIYLAASNDTACTKLSYAVADAEKYPLPPGLKVSGSKVTGVPSKNGTFTTVLRVTGTDASGAAIPGQTMQVKFVVKTLYLAAGTFSGILETEDDRVTSGTEDGLAAAGFGSISVTTKTTGSISAKLKIGGETYSFSGSNWDETLILSNGKPAVRAKLSYVTTLERKPKKPTLTVTNTLELVACRGTESDPVALDTPLVAKAELTLIAANRLSYVTNLVWNGEALRDNTAVESVAKRLKPFAGYYTVSLMPEDYYEGVQGNGYLTVTVDDKGQAKIAGLLADNVTKISASAPCGILSPAVGDAGTDEMILPVCYSTPTNSFGGWIRFKVADDGVPVARSEQSSSERCIAPLRWVGTCSAATIAGDDGFAVILTPQGGYYDTVVNLQRYYYDLGYGWSIPMFDDLSSFTDYLLGGSTKYFDLIAYPAMNETGAEALDIVNDSVTMAAQKLAYRSDNAKLIDWEKTVNPSNLKFSFTRATGLYKGSFEIWKGDDSSGSETVQKKCGTYDYRGILLMARDSGAGSTEISEMDPIAPGSYVLPLTIKDETDAGTVKRAVNANYPFLIMPVAVENPWDDPEWQEELPVKN